MSISAVVITKNEEANIERCLKSVDWADEIVVLDSDSTDRTVELARQLGAKVFTVPFVGYGPAKQQATDRASGDWILSIDADEEVTPELAREIQGRLESPGDVVGFYIKRKTSFLGRWIYHCGWYPDPVLRLFHKSHGGFDDAVIHEKVEVRGRVEQLQGELLHYSYPDLESYLSRSNRYTTLGAHKAFEQGRRTRWFDLVVRPAISFITHFVGRQGFRDGMEGFMVSVLSANAVFVKYAKLRRLQKQNKNSEVISDAQDN